MKFVTMFADFDSGKCISFITYVIRLFPTAAIPIISNACTPAHIYTHKFKFNLI